MCGLSGEPEVTNQSFGAYMGIARSPMGQNPLRLYGTNQEEDDSCVCRLTFEVSRLKWIEAHAVNSATSQATIEKFRLVFFTHGLPDVLVSDNGTPLTKHLTSAYYHPASNGLTERAIQTLKNTLRKDPVEPVSKLRSHVSSFVTASLLIPLLPYHQLNFSWARDPDLVLTSCTQTSPRESRKDSWIKRRVIINIANSENCPLVKHSGLETLELVVHGFLGLSVKSLVSRDFEYL